jgi:hypothetical protein
MNGVCYISAMPIGGRARGLGMEFGVGDLLLRYDLFIFLIEQTNYSYFVLKENHNAHPIRNDVDVHRLYRLENANSIRVKPILFSYYGSFHLIRIQVTRRF